MIRFDSVAKRFDGREVLAGVSFAVAKGEVDFGVLVCDELSGEEGEEILRKMGENQNAANQI